VILATGAIGLAEARRLAARLRPGR
jgi:hypothetical protein